MSPFAFLKAGTTLDRAIIASVAAMLAMNLGVMAQHLGGVPHSALTPALAQFAAASSGEAFPA